MVKIWHWMIGFEKWWMKKRWPFPRVAKIRVTKEGHSRQTSHQHNNITIASHNNGKNGNKPTTYPQFIPLVCMPAICVIDPKWTLPTDLFVSPSCHRFSWLNDIGFRFLPYMLIISNRPPLSSSPLPSFFCLGGPNPRRVPFPNLSTLLRD